MKLSTKSNMVRLFVNETRCLSSLTGHGIRSNIACNGWNCNNCNCNHLSHSLNNSTTRLNKTYFSSNQQRDTNANNEEQDEQDNQNKEEKNENDENEEQLSESDVSDSDSGLEARV